ncbi:MAG: glycosyltransferase [Erythrobacter sp.]
MTPAAPGGDEGCKRPLILHVSGDFPDAFETFKTPVIKRLIELTSDAFEHRVISINRVQPSSTALLRSLVGGDRLVTEKRSFVHGVALRYEAPGKGIRHRTKLEQLGHVIAGEVAAMERKPDLIVGHKLTIEGIAVSVAARETGLPYALSIQGNTDLKILSSRPDLRSVFAEIFHGAQVVFPFAPWALKGAQGALGERSGPSHLLPCPTDLDTPSTPKPGGDGLVSVFHLKNHPGKNLSGMIEAFRILATHGSPPPLAVIGGGSEEQVAACEALAAEFQQITFPGPLGRPELAQRLAKASALVLPSLRESFGLVFIEALFAGTPIIYPAGTAVDGYFDGCAFALRVDARKPRSIADAIAAAIENETEMKRALAEWQASPAAEIFTRDHIAATFAKGLHQATRRM